MLTVALPLIITQTLAFTEGLKDVDESLKLHPNYVKALLCRARILAGLELYESATDEYRSALEQHRAAMSPVDVTKVETELQDIEELLRKERNKEPDHYAALGNVSQL